MSRKGSILVFCINAAVFLVLEGAALVMLRNNGPLQDLWLTRASHTFMATVWGATESVTQYFSLKKENEELSDLVFRQQQALRRYEEITGKDFGGDTVPDIVGGFRYIPATVIKLSDNTQHNYFIISKGSEAGVVVKSGIITDEGVIGIIDAVGRHYSYGRAFKNFDMTISARIGHEGAVGALSWDGIGSNAAILREVPQHIPIHQGDTIYTSGYSAIFPPDIPLGVLGEYRIKNGATYEIKVELFEDLSSVRYVTVVNNIHAEEISELEGVR